MFQLKTVVVHTAVVLRYTNICGLSKLETCEDIDEHESEELLSVAICSENLSVIKIVCSKEVDEGLYIG